MNRHDPELKRQEIDTTENRHNRQSFGILFTKIDDTTSTQRSRVVQVAKQVHKVLKNIFYLTKDLFYSLGRR